MSAGSHKSAVFAHFCIIRLALLQARDDLFEEDENKRIFISKASNIVEALGNLAYLICEDADHPEKVKYYTNMCEERLTAFRELLADIK